MLSIVFQTIRLVLEARKNQRDAEWYFVHKLHMMMDKLKHYKCAHSRLFAVSYFIYYLHLN